MSDNNEAQRLKQVLAENAAYKWTMQRGINNPQAAQILANNIMETTVLTGGQLQPLGEGKNIQSTLTSSFFANNLLRDHYADQVRQYEAQQSQKAPAQGQQSQQTDQAKQQQDANQSIPDPAKKPYKQWSLAEKSAYRKAKGDSELSRVIHESVKAEREQKQREKENR